MTTYGIVIEGEYDEAALTEIIKKCISSEIEIIPRKCGAKDRLMRMFSGFLESFRREKQGSDVDKAIVIRDSHGKNPDELKEKMRNKITNRNYSFDVKFIVIVQELEAWFLADEEAISRVTKSSVSRINENLESISDPKQILNRILSDTRVAYTKAVAQEIAKELNLDKIEYRCPTFKEFRQAVIDC